MPDDEKVFGEGSIKVDRDNIKIGMYVSELDIPWEGSGFAFQGFFVATNRQVEALKDRCAYVIVAKSRSAAGLFIQQVKPEIINTPTAPAPVATYTQTADQPSKETESIATLANEIIGAPAALFRWSFEIFGEIFSPKPKPSASFEQTESNAKMEAAIRLVRQKDAARIFKQFENNDNRQIMLYSNSSDIQSEVKSAVKMKDLLVDALPNLVEEMSSSSIASQINFSKEALGDVVESMIRNPEAMQLVSRLNSAEAGAVQRAMDFSLLMISFGRELGLSKDELVDVGIGGLLHDIGVTKVLGGVFNKKKIRTAAEMKIYKSHAELGLQALDEMNIKNPIMRAIVGMHHERADGNGFPKGLKGNEIGLYGSMAVICEGYVGMVSGNNRASPTTPSHAITKMIEQSGTVYHAALMQQFIQVVGLYPVGSVVMLSTQEVGIIVSQNRLWRLRPVVRLILNPKGRRYKIQPHMDLKHKSVAEIFISKEIPHGHPQILSRDYLLE